MFALVHDMRTRILTGGRRSSERIIGAILFEDTVFNRLVEGLGPRRTPGTKRASPVFKNDQGWSPRRPSCPGL